MLETYKKWIAENVKGNGYGECSEITEQMAEAFPELTRVRGHYYCSAWGERTHWWLVTSDDEIIDPTVEQFPSKGKGVYDSWVEGTEEPTGKCPNCGGYCYGSRYFCSNSCGVEYSAYCST